MAAAGPKELNQQSALSSFPAPAPAPAPVPIPAVQDDRASSITRTFDTKAMTRHNRILLSCALTILSILLVNTNVSAQEEWTEPFPAFRIVGNVYYVGSKGLANYLITTPKGHILINSDLEANVPLIKSSIESLGFKFSDVKILLISHAHWDHCAGSAKIKELTGAKYMVMDADVPVVESGGKTDFQYANDSSTLYTPTKVDRVLHDEDEVKLGGVKLVAHLTPGHTKGCTTWTIKVKDNSRTRDVVIVGSPNVNPGYKLVGNTLYPGISDDYARGFRVLKSLSCDIFLGAHGNYYGMEDKYRKLKAGDATAFIDPEGYRAYVAEREQAFLKELEKQSQKSKVRG